MRSVSRETGKGWGFQIACLTPVSRSPIAKFPIRKALTLVQRKACQDQRGNGSQFVNSLLTSFLVLIPESIHPNL